MDTSTHSFVLAGVVPPVCDAEAGQDRSVDHIRRLAESSSDGGGLGREYEVADSVSAARGLPIARFRALMVEVCRALKSALDNERGAAEDSLRRAVAMLNEIGEPRASVKDGRGGLAPWQIRKVANYVETHLGRTLRNEDLAALVRLNPSHFGRAFRNSFGEPPHEYVIRRRVERAQGLMLSTGASLSDIALDCGLSDQSHLTRLFRRIVGETPRAWRRARIGTAL